MERNRDEACLWVGTEIREKMRATNRVVTTAPAGPDLAAGRHVMKQLAHAKRNRLNLRIESLASKPEEDRIVNTQTRRAEVFSNHATPTARLPNASRATLA